MFFKKELQVTRNAKECERIRQMLDSAGIKYSVKYGIGSIGDPDRSRGIPGINYAAEEQYSIHVSRKDYKKARSLFKF